MIKSGRPYPLPHLYYLVKRRILKRLALWGKQHISRHAATTILRSRELDSGDILFIYETECPSQVYRILHPSSALNKMGLSGRMISLAEMEYLKDYDFLKHFRAVLIHRLPWSYPIQRLFRATSAFRIPVILDLDDFIFDPGIYSESNIFSHLDELEKKLHLKMAAEVKRTLRKADLVTVSTSPLLSAITAMDKPGFLIPNCISDEMIRAADAAVANRTEEQGIKIGYISGTFTHDDDFRSIVPALDHTLSRYPETTLILAGPLQIDERFSGKFARQIKRIGTVPWDQVPTLYQQLDINLAPLAINNRFCEGKSAIKYLEAALQGIPTICSRTRPFMETVRNGETGILCHSVGEWKTGLEQLIESENFRKSMGMAARQDACERHHLDTTIPQWKSVLQTAENTR